MPSTTLFSHFNTCVISFNHPDPVKPAKGDCVCMYNSRLESSKAASYANTNCRNQELVESVGSRLACHDRLHQNGTPALPHFQRKLPKGPHSSGLQIASKTWTCQRIFQWPSIIHDFHDQPSQILCSSKLLHIPSPLSQPVSASSASCKRLPSIKRMLSSMACKSWSHRACTWQETSKDTLQTNIQNINIFGDILKRRHRCCPSLPHTPRYAPQAPLPLDRLRRTWLQPASTWLRRDLFNENSSPTPTASSLASTEAENESTKSPKIEAKHAESQLVLLRASWAGFLPKFLRVWVYAGRKWLLFQAANSFTQDVRAQVENEYELGMFGHVSHLVILMLSFQWFCETSSALHLSWTLVFSQPRKQHRVTVALPKATPRPTPGMRPIQLLCVNAQPITCKDAWKERALPTLINSCWKNLASSKLTAFFVFDVLSMQEKTKLVYIYNVF